MLDAHILPRFKPKRREKQAVAATNASDAIMWSTDFILMSAGVTDIIAACVIGGVSLKGGQDSSAMVSPARACISGSSLKSGRWCIKALVL